MTTVEPTTATTTDFSYVTEKIRAADFAQQPFKHIEIEDLIEREHFDAIVASPEIRLNHVGNDAALFDELFARGYKIIDFPGCVTDKQEYLNWHVDKKKSHRIGTSNEGFGVVLRLETPQSKVIADLQQFLDSDEFVSCIAEKFGIDPQECNYDAGIQKYLDGYEISPHPDIRRKALTFMVNINPGPASEDDDYHTRYLEFHPQWAYVREFWKSNPEHDRCWVPWDWCDVKRQQRRNNSIVLFAPAHDTLHAVKANYDHLQHQRTQLYGNLWYNDQPLLKTPRWEDFVMRPTPAGGVIDQALRKGVRMAKQILPEPVRDFIVHARARSGDTHASRNT